jgi:hypothetical protein
VRDRERMTVSFWWFSKPFFAFNRVGMKKNPISSKSER